MLRLANAGIDQLADRLAGTTTAAIVTIVDRRGPAIAAAAERLREDAPGASPGTIARNAVRYRARVVAGTGATSALPALLPGFGTVTEIAAALGDVSYLTVVQVELVLLIAHLYGRSLDDHEARRLDVLLALGVEAGAVKLHRDGSVKVGSERIPPGQLRGLAEDELASRVNRYLAGQVVVRLARRRAHVVIGREVPVLGIGLAAVYNHWSTRRLGSSAIAFFEHLG